MDLSDRPFLDAHMHPPRRAPLGGVSELRRSFYEGDPTSAAAVVSTLPYLDGLRRIARSLGCAADETEVAGRLAATDPANRLSEVVRLARIDALVADTGYPPPGETLRPAELEAAAGVPVCRLLRLESAAAELLPLARDLATLEDAIRAQVAGARSEGYGGLKTIIAYRSGLAVRPPELGAAEAGFARERASSTGRLSDKALLDHLLIAALEENAGEALPVQVHCGFGDSDIDATLGNPLGLRWLVEAGPARGFPVVLLHGAWPHVEAAAWMAAVQPHVILDICTCIPPIGWTGVHDMLRAALAVAPMRQIHLSSDAPALADQILVGAEIGREALGEALGELRSRQLLSLRACEAAADDILWRNARRIYWDEEYPI